MKMLEPRRDIDELRKARGMAFRETVAAETLDLLEAAFRKRRIVAARDHVADHLVFEFADGADVPKRRHRAAQSVGFFGSKFCRLDGDAHRLFLKQRYTERLVQDIIQFILVTMVGRR